MCTDCRHVFNARQCCHQSGPCARMLKCPQSTLRPPSLTIANRTPQANQIRGLLREFGLVLLSILCESAHSFELNALRRIANCLLVGPARVLSTLSQINQSLFRDIDVERPDGLVCDAVSRPPA